MPFFFCVKIFSFIMMSFPDALHPFDIIMISRKYDFVNVPDKSLFFNYMI